MQSIRIIKRGKSEPFTANPDQEQMTNAQSTRQMGSTVKSWINERNDHREQERMSGSPFGKLRVRLVLIFLVICALGTASVVTSFARHFAELSGQS